MTFLGNLSNDARPDGPYPASEISGSDSNPQLSQLIEQAKAKLAEAQREAFELDQIQDLPRAEAAKLADCSPSQFADRLYRAKKCLKQLLKDLPQCILL